MNSVSSALDGLAGNHEGKHLNGHALDWDSTVLGQLGNTLAIGALAWLFTRHVDRQELCATIRRATSTTRIAIRLDWAWVSRQLSIKNWKCLTRGRKTTPVTLILHIQQRPNQPQTTDLG